MRKRCGFVSNSSSCSFVVCSKVSAYTEEERKRIFREVMDEIEEYLEFISPDSERYKKFLQLRGKIEETYNSGGYAGFINVPYDVLESNFLEKLKAGCGLEFFDIENLELAEI